MAQTPPANKQSSYIASLIGVVLLVIAMGLEGGLAIALYILGIVCFITAMVLNRRR